MKIAGVVGIILVVLGALIILGSSLSDLVLSIPGFGIKQAGGVAVGAIDVVLGLILLLTRKSR